MTYERRKSAFVEHRIFGNAITRINTYPLFDAQGEVRAIINHKRDVTMERQLEDLKRQFGRRQSRIENTSHIHYWLQQTQSKAYDATLGTTIGEFPAQGSRHLSSNHHR